MAKIIGSRMVAPSSNNAITSTAITLETSYVQATGNFLVSNNLTPTLQASNAYIQSNDNNPGNAIDNPGGAPYANGINPVNNKKIDGYGLSVGAVTGTLDLNGVPTLYSSTGERQQAQAYFEGGVGIEQDLAVGGYIYGRVAYANTASTSSFITVKPVDNNQIYYPTFTDATGLTVPGAQLYGDNASIYPSSLGLTYNPAAGLLTTDQAHIAATINSVSTITGAFTVTGGVGIGQDIYIGGNVLPGSTATVAPSSIGDTGTAWATAYLENIYTKFLGNNSGNISVSPNNGINLPKNQNGNVVGGGVMDVFGDIRVRGNNPVGTAPVVTNVLYVTMDGDDTNDGRAMDPSRACRTVSGAVKSPYYQPGTQIRVAPGHYLEDNPIQLKPYTSVMGSDIRTTGIEPINKTQDLFHMNSGCYLAFMQFLNGRSGLLPGTGYINGTNRGAYCTAFPPGKQIDLFHSPYIQNCTNLSGPWLVDGTLFTPDQTVQVPVAVGTGTWAANTTSITVYIENMPINGFINAGPAGSAATQYTGSLQSTLNFTGTVATANLLSSKSNPRLYDAYTATDTGAVWVYTAAENLAIGMNATVGQQNPGFFNARTLMLANKPFLQAQVASYLVNTFANGTFSYNSATCSRDVGLIVDAISMDMLYNSTSDSTFAGLQYWSQGGYTGQIARELTTTTAAINYLKSLVANTITNFSIGGTTATSITNGLFNTITTILGAGTPTDITNQVVPESLSTSNVFINAAYNAVQSARTTLQQEVYNYVVSPSGLNYSASNFTTATCYRDVGYIIDSVCFDMLHGGNLQSLKSGVYYYGYTTSTQVPSEITQVTAAYTFIQSIIPYIVTGQSVPKKYSNSTQVISGTPGTIAEANILQNNINVITDIIVNGPVASGPKTPQNLTLTNDTNAVNAWTLLHANRAFIQAEVIAFIAATMQTVSYDTSTIQLSYRDAGILVENIAYDAAYGGNQKAVESGNAYWNGPVSYIANSIPQCVAAINYLNDLIQDVIVNNTCTVLPPVVNIPNVPQVINTVLVDGGVAGTAISSLFNIVTDIIVQGPQAAPASYTSTGPDAAYVSAEILLQANRKFIQENTLNYINWNLVQPTGPSYLPYNKVKCQRDAGLIVDSIATDLLFPTAKYSQTTFAGLQYYNQGSYTGNIPNEITTTTAAIAYLQTIANKVITNTTATDDLLLGITRYSNATQITNIQPGTAAEVATVNTEFATILSILRGNVSGWTDLIVSNGGTASTLSSVQNTYALLQANIPYMQAEVLAYIESPAGLNYPSTSFNTSTCVRDIGYIINSISFDLLYGGNRQAIQSGLSYYSQNGSTVIPQETFATSQAFSFLGSVIGTLITNPSGYNPYQTKVLPVTSLPLADVTVANTVTTIVSTLTNIITNGPTGYEFTPVSLTVNPSQDFVNAYNIIEANRSFLVAETLAWIDYTYNSTSTFVFNTATCSRDTGLIVDAIGMDMLYASLSDSTFAGLQYWSQGSYTGNVGSEVSAIVSATNFLSSLVANTATTFGSPAIGTLVTGLFSTITNIISNGVVGITDQVKFGTTATTTATYVAAYNAIQAHRTSFQNSVMSYLYINYPTLSYTTATCFRDVGYMIDAVSFDLLHGGNIQSIKSGVYYWGYNNNTQLPAEVPETISAYNFIGNIVQNIVTGNTIANPYQSVVPQVVVGYTPATVIEAQQLKQKIAEITKIIVNGPSAAGPKTPQSLTPSYDANAQNAWALLHANRSFIIAEVLAYLAKTASITPFAYDQGYCYRDIGLMVDAVSQDVLLGGNQRSVEAGLSYWNQGYNYIANELTTTTQAISYISSIAQQIANNQPVAVITGTVAKQVINPFFQYGGNYMPQQAIARNFGIISTIINQGPDFAPPVYAGGGIFALTGTNGLDVKSSPTITSITPVATGTYILGLSTATIGAGNNATLYFGNTRVFPLQNSEVDALSLTQTGSTSTWDSRKVDSIGAMGGSLVDGSVVSDRSPIQSFVYDAFTQLTQGGVGVKVTNNGYAQLVSVFTIFASVGVQVDNGGIASIVNSNANFGDLCLVAKGYGSRAFSGTVYNPINRAYPFSPQEVYGANSLDQYYPEGYFPDSKGNIEVFVPDIDNRPHISLVMEVVPPSSYSSAYNSPELAANGVVIQGFLNAQPTTSTLITGTISLSGVDTTDVHIGNNVYVIDQFGFPYDKFPYKHDEFGNYISSTGTVLAIQNTGAPGFLTQNPPPVVNTNYGVLYCATGTTVVDINYNSITLSQALTSGASFPDNSSYFTIYFSGNAYYDVLTSNVANQPYVTGTNILSANTNPLFNGPTVSQIDAHAAAIRYLNTLTDYVINNTVYSPTYQNTVTQVTNSSFSGGSASQPFIDLRFGYLETIVTATNLNAALSVVPSSLITKTGTIPNGAGSAIDLINANLSFMTAEVVAYVNHFYASVYNGATMSHGQAQKCVRDVALILQQLIYDLETGGNYNMVYAGLSYWSRPGTYHIVEMEQAVTDPTLFPDGATVNFYQRSYISASGYVFEYVGAGTNYGALPQVGQADPIQARETVQLGGGKVFFTSTDQNGDFRIGPSLVISQATGVISGRTFVQSLFANMTPFILAIEAL